MIGRSKHATSFIVLSLRSPRGNKGSEHLAKMTRRAKHPDIRQSLFAKIFHFPEFRICGIERSSRPSQRGASRSSRDAGRGAVDAVAPARKAMTGRATVSQARRGTTRRGHSGFGRRRRRAHASPWRSGRSRPRTEKSCGPDARSSGVKSGGDAATNRRASISREATGAIVQRSPRRARRTPLKPSAQGRPGDRQHL